MTIEPSSSGVAEPAGRDVDDPRLAVAGGGDDAGLRAGEASAPRSRAWRWRWPAAPCEIRSPAVSSMSSSRPGGSAVIWLAWSSSSSVRVAHGGDDDDHVVAVLLRLDDALGDALHALGVRDGGAAVLLYHQGHGSRLPRCRAGPAVACRTGAGCDHRMDDPEDWLLTDDERGNPATVAPGLDRGQPRRAAGPRRHLLRPAGRRGRGARTRATTCSSPTGGATPTSGCARTARRSASCSPTPPSAGCACAGWSGARTGTGCRFSKEENRALDREIEHGRRRGRARPAGAPRWAATTRSSSSCGTTTTRPATSPSPAASTCATPAGTTPSTAATRSRSRWPRPTARSRRGTTCSCSCAARRSACWTPCSASAGTTRTAPTPTTRSPGCTTSCATPGCTPTRCRRSCPRPPECGPHLVQTLRTYPAIRPPYAFAPRRASGRWPGATPRRSAGPAG